MTPAACLPGRRAIAGPALAALNDLAGFDVLRPMAGNRVSLGADRYNEKTRI